MRWEHVFLTSYLMARVFEEELRDVLDSLYNVLDSFFLSVLEDWAGVCMS